MGSGAAQNRKGRQWQKNNKKGCYGNHWLNYRGVCTVSRQFYPSHFPLYENRIVI